MRRMGKTISRRRVLSSSGAAAAALSIVPAHVLGGIAGENHVPPSEKLNIAGIGFGGVGAVNLRNMETENIVALCDVDHAYTAKIFERYPKAQRYTDYRKMLERQKDIDAVMIATPDHTHAVIAMAAMRAGKHVYCQKPLAHDIYECRALAAAAAQYKVVTQLGIQYHSSESARILCEWIWDGAIGEVREVDAWCSLTYYPWGHASWSSKYDKRPTDTPPKPEGLDWDLWLGPAPARPYHPAYHPRTWRCWWDFGSGMMGDRGVHTLDPVVWALKLAQTMPTSIEATSCGMTPEQHPLSRVVTYQFPARDDKDTGKKLPPLKLTWYDGTRAPRPRELADNIPMGDKEGGVIFKGTKGILMCGTYANALRLAPESLMQSYQRPAKTLPRVEGGNHEQDFLRAIKAGAHKEQGSASNPGNPGNSGNPGNPGNPSNPSQKPCADFAYGAALTEICILGNIATRVDGRIEYDGASMRVTNFSEANKYVRKTYRAGWTL